MSGSTRFQLISLGEFHHHQRLFSSRSEDVQQQQIAELFEAAKSDATNAQLADLLSNSVDPNVRNLETDLTPLLIATIDKQVQNTRLLLRYRAEALAVSGAVVRDHQFVSKKSEGFTSMEGDTELVAPVIATVLGNFELLQAFISAQTFIPPKFRNEMHHFAAQADAVFKRQHDELVERGETDTTFISRNTMGLQYMFRPKTI